MHRSPASSSALPFQHIDIQRQMHCIPRHGVCITEIQHFFSWQTGTHPAQSDPSLSKLSELLPWIGNNGT
jgi:hypothetical protein